MNFKPTLWKSIVSVIVALVLASILYFILFPCEASVFVEPDGEITHGDPACAFDPFFYFPQFWILFIIDLIIIYIIWSLIQKKK